MFSSHPNPLPLHYLETSVVPAISVTSFASPGALALFAIATTVAAAVGGAAIVQVASATTVSGLSVGHVLG